jgi:hypothetical protein
MFVVRSNCRAAIIRSAASDCAVERAPVCELVEMLKVEAVVCKLAPPTESRLVERLMPGCLL